MATEPQPTGSRETSDGHGATAHRKQGPLMATESQPTGNRETYDGHGAISFRPMLTYPPTGSHFGTLLAKHWHLTP